MAVMGSFAFPRDAGVARRSSRAADGGEGYSRSMLAPRLLCLSSVALVFACDAREPSAVQPVSSSAPSASPPPVKAAAGVPMLTAAPPPMGSERVVFRLYKLLAEAGVEQDTFVPAQGGGTEAKAVFSYRDRGQAMPLASRYEFAADGSLRSYAAWGRTSRHTNLDDRVSATEGGFLTSREGADPKTTTSEKLAVAVSGYAPMLGQDLLLRAWQQHGRPLKMATLPAGEVTVEARGKETYEQKSGKVTLEHVVVTGLVWGREDTWLDDKGELLAVVTRDAEFDEFEAVREGFGALLPELTRAASADGVAWLATAAKGAERGEAGVRAYVGARLVDGTGKPAVDDAVVVVDGDRIVAAGPRASVAIPEGAAPFDVKGKTIIPGLWDMHAHVEQVEQGVVYLAAGVTSVRDMGNVLDFITGMRDALAEGKGIGPRIVVEGIVDGGGDAAIGTVRIKNAEDIAPTLDALKKAGCVDVKIYSSIEPSLVKPIVAYAHSHGMRAVGHVPNGMRTEDAILAGYDSISHIRYLFDPALPPSATKGLSREAVYQKTSESTSRRRRWRTRSPTSWRTTWSSTTRSRSSSSFSTRPPRTRCASRASPRSRPSSWPRWAGCRRPWPRRETSRSRSTSRSSASCTSAASRWSPGRTSRCPDTRCTASSSST